MWLASAGCEPLVKTAIADEPDDEAVFQRWLTQTDERYDRKITDGRWISTYGWLSGVAILGFFDISSDH